MKSATIQLETLTCPSCMQKIENAVKGVEGVEKDSLKVLFNTSRVKLDFDEEVTSIDDIQASITKVGYEILKTKVK